LEIRETKPRRMYFPEKTQQTLMRTPVTPAIFEIGPLAGPESFRRTGRLAVYSDVCMKEIAYLLGFSDTAHFSKFFKKSTGMNFSEFKRNKEPEMLIG